MSQIEARLKQMKAYREKAMQNPIANRLYIEDLDLSIAAFEEQVKYANPMVQQGWADE